MQKFFHQAGAAPKIAGYLASILSLLGCVGLAFWGLAASFEYRTSVSTSRFQEELQRRDFSSARRTIGLLADPSSLDSYASGTDDIKARKDKLKQATWDLLAVAENLKPERLNAANAAFERADRGFDELRMLNGKEALDAAFQSTAKALEDLRDSDGQIEELKRSLKSWTEEYAVLAGRFSRLLSLAAENRDPDPNKPLPFYSSGALAGLPKLAGIPDDMTDLVAVREAMVQAGGRVNLEGNDLAKLFQAELNELLESSSKVNRGHSEALENLKNITLRKRQAQENFKSFEERLVAEITRFAVSRWEKTNS